MTWNIFQTYSCTSHQHPIWLCVLYLHLVIHGPCKYMYRWSWVWRREGSTWRRHVL